MKGDHRKTEGATRFDFHKHIVKVETGIRAKRRSHGSCKRPGEKAKRARRGRTIRGHGREHSSGAAAAAAAAAPAAAAGVASLLKLIRKQKKPCANRTRLPKADTPRLREGCTTRNHDCRISKDIRQSTRTERDRVEQSQIAISIIDNTSRSRHARNTVRRDNSKTQMCRRQRRDANCSNTGYNSIEQMRWSKWTSTHKTEAVRIERFAKMRECWFKMRSDHRKTEGATRSDFRKHIVKVQTGIRAKRRSHRSCKRAGKNSEKSKEGSHNLNNHQI